MLASPTAEDLAPPCCLCPKTSLATSPTVTATPRSQHSMLRHGCGRPRFSASVCISRSFCCPVVRAQARGHLQHTPRRPVFSKHIRLHYHQTFAQSSSLSQSSVCGSLSITQPPGKAASLLTVFQPNPEATIERRLEHHMPQAYTHYPDFLKFLGH